MGLFRKKATADQEELVAEVRGLAAQERVLLATAVHEQTSKDCSLHKTHNPGATYNEKHHVIPRAWQYAWHPGDAPIVILPNMERLGHSDLFDKRTVAICPTGHRNVHFWLEHLMRELQATPGSSLDAVIASTSRWARKNKTPLSPHELSCAVLAITRWLEAGGDPLALGEIGQYGQI